MCKVPAVTATAVRQRKVVASAVLLEHRVAVHLRLEVAARRAVLRGLLHIQVDVESSRHLELTRGRRERVEGRKRGRHGHGALRREPA